MAGKYHQICPIQKKKKFCECTARRRQGLGEIFLFTKRERFDQTLVRKEPVVGRKDPDGKGGVLPGEM